MARQLETAPGQVRVLFAPAEAESFMRWGALTPCSGTADPLSRAIRRTMQELAFDLAMAADFVELVIEPAPEVVDGPHAWWAVRFRLDGDAVVNAGEDPTLLGEWLAAHTPQLAFAIEAERPVPVYREPA